MFGQEVQKNNKHHALRAVLMSNQKSLNRYKNLFELSVVYLIYPIKFYMVFSKKKHWQRADDIVLKGKPALTAGNPQNHSNK